MLKQLLIAVGLITVSPIKQIRLSAMRSYFMFQVMVVIAVVLIVFMFIPKTENTRDERRIDSEENLTKFLATEFEEAVSDWLNKIAVADWNYQADLYNKEKKENYVSTTIKNLFLWSQIHM